MESFFSFSTLFNLVLTVIWFISGIRDLQGKDPFIDLPFNQYHRDPEYRAFWQKKNGVFYMLNSIAFLILAFTPVTSLLYRIIFGIAIVGDLLYLVAYESWNHSADCQPERGHHEFESFGLGLAERCPGRTVFVPRHPGSVQWHRHRMEQ